MLPTKGYFQDIECPFYNTTCGRPYCHFRHKRKANEIVEEPSQETAKTTVPTYKPTPKSELASIHSQRSHIPISYVPDLSYKRDRHIRPIKIDKPTYNPTPLSILSSATQADPSESELNNSTIRNIQENIASTIYDPLKSEINFEELSNEFEAIDNIIESVHEEPQNVIDEGLDEVNSKIKKEPDELSLSPPGRELDIKNEDASKPDLFDSLKEASKTEDLFDQLKKEKLVEIKKEPEEVILRVIPKSEKPDKKRSDKDSKKSDKNHGDKDSKSSSRSKNSSSAKEKSIKDKDNKTSKEKEEKNSEKSSASFHKSKERDKHRKAEKKDSSKSKSSSKDKERRKSKDHDKKKSKTKSESTNGSESEGTSTVSSPERHRKEKKKASSNKEKSIIIKSHRSRSKEKSKKKSSRKSKSRSRSKSKEKREEKAKKKSLKKSQSRSRSRSESKEKAKKKSSRKSKSRSRSRSKSKEKAKKKSSRKSKSRSRSRSTSKEKAKKKSSRKSKSRSRSRSKSKEKNKHKSSSRAKHHEDSKNKDKVSKEKDTKGKDRESSKSSNSKNVQETTKKDKEILVDSPTHDDLDTHDIVIVDTEDVLPDDIDLDFEDEDETLKECYRIFTEYKPEPIKKPSDESESNEGILEYVPTQIKKRKAYDGAELSTTHYKLPTVAPPKSVTLPGQMLTNRYKIAKMAQASNEQESIMNEIKSMTQTAKRPASSLLEAARLHKIKRLQKAKEKEKPKDNIVDDILNGSHKPSAPVVKVQSKKIAAVPNVALIEKAKKRISLVKKQREEENVKTIAHTAKGGRVAHVPEYNLDELPDVLQADRSKLPVNVRSRFLTMIAEECAKLYASKEDAYNRALNEEFSCYEKCKVLATYRNSAMLAVNRLRKELQERDSKGLGRLLSGESSSNKKESNFEGKTFYKNVKKWILTDEELDIHGYPRESSEKGVAIINNRAEIDFSIVDENQRRCSRCGTIYQVDDEGWPLFDEECMYHPMKKRTIRREQVYLCCKSSEETGCAMSDTHVFDGLPKHLLEGYQTTLPPESEDDPRSTQVYALDCEMCYTTKGLELTRLTVVDTECKTVYESLVKPMNPIIDYNTRFSGITKDQMDRTGTNILQVQANILHLCNSETILVGHSLESDMKALKIIHGTIIDTSVLFPHKMGLPHKKALRALASEYLQKIIQNDVSGHDSAEDAIACMDLIKWKLKEELKTKVK